MLSLSFFGLIIPVFQTFPESDCCQQKHVSYYIMSFALSMIFSCDCVSEVYLLLGIFTAAYLLILFNNHAEIDRSVWQKGEWPLP